MQRGSIMPGVIFFVLLSMMVGVYVWYVYTPTLIDTSVLPKRQGVEEEFSYWQKEADMPTARSEISAGVLNEKIYVVGGRSGVAGTLSTVEVYDPASDSWSRVADLPQGLHSTAVVAYQGKLYVIGGYQGIANVSKNNVYIYDPELNKWEEGIPLPEGRGDHGAAVIGNHIYVVGGVVGKSVSKELLRFDFETQKWERLPEMAVARDQMAVASIGNQLLVAGGREKSARKNLSSLEIFTVFPDSSSSSEEEDEFLLPGKPVGEWSKGPSMVKERGGVTGTTLGSAIVVSGGEKFMGTFPEVAAYDIRTQKWHDFPPLNFARQGSASAVVGDTLYVIGGGRHAWLSVSKIVESLTVTTR